MPYSQIVIRRWKWQKKKKMNKYEYICYNVNYLRIEIKLIWIKYIEAILLW